MVGIMILFMMEGCFKACCCCFYVPVVLLTLFYGVFKPFMVFRHCSAVFLCLSYSVPGSVRCTFRSPYSRGNKPASHRETPAVLLSDIVRKGNRWGHTPGAGRRPAPGQPYYFIPTLLPLAATGFMPINCCISFTWAASWA